VASRHALAFTDLATRLTEPNGGLVVKTPGDGVLARFDDAVSGCRAAALELRLATEEHLDLRMSAGLTAGQPRHVDLGEASSA
jgi:class 3 adenylate cyclase